jgi:hypothetical protein
VTKVDAIELMRRREACRKHIPAPIDYLNWHMWAEQKSKTHEQRQCGGCGLWAIWVRRSKAGEA